MKKKFSKPYKNAFPWNHIEFSSFLYFFRKNMVHQNMENSYVEKQLDFSCLSHWNVAAQIWVQQSYNVIQGKHKLNQNVKFRPYK